MEEQWYGVTLQFRCRVGDGVAGPWTCDEQIRVIRARDEETARRKAQELGKKEEHSYDNQFGELVSWECIALTNIYAIIEETIADGTEISSRLYEETAFPESTIDPPRS